MIRSDCHATTNHIEIMTELMRELNMTIGPAELNAHSNDIDNPEPAFIAWSLYQFLETRAMYLATAREAAVTIQRDLQHVLDGTTWPADTHALQTYLIWADKAEAMRPGVNEALECYQQHQAHR